MNLANWTTRLLGDSAPASDDSQREEPALGAAPPSLVGSRVGAYLITKRLGAGGVGEVFKGVDEMLKREVAIKVLRDELASDPVFLKRFSNEAQLLAKLSHPNVASVHAFLHEGDKQLMVMEYVAGIGLDEFVRAGGPVPIERALTIFRRALDGIEHAHANGIVHRDIKPANIMLADSGQVKVMDFGIARALDCQENLTRHGQVAGTAKAMSPEQIRGQKADVRSDIYSLGIVLYTLLAGRPPFEDGSDHALMMAQLEQAPPPLRGLVGNLPSKVEAAVMRALEKDPSARFQTAREFARAIDACLADLAPAAKPAANRPLDGAATASRTAINPALQGVQQLPVGSGRAAASAPARSAGPRWVRVGAVSAAVLALVGGAALLWTQRSSLDTPANASTPPPAVTPQTSVSQAPSGEPLPPPAPVAEPAPAVAPEPVVAAQVPARAPQMPVPATAPPLSPTLAIEFAPLRTLAIARMAAGTGAAAGATDSAQTFQPGERIRLLVKPSVDSHVYCYLQDENRRILRFYPNRFHKSALVKAGAPREIPGKMRFELVANRLGVTETIACFASPRDLMAELPHAVAGPDLTPLPVASLDDVKSAFVRLAGNALAEASLSVQVK
jgi:tRNA A-37 threonylcarbamoyl transferase component Bud32